MPGNFGEDFERNREMKSPQIGDYVFCSGWADGTPYDPWRVGFLEKIETIVNISGVRKYYYVDFDKHHYKHCKKITQEHGTMICEVYPACEKIGGVPLTIRNKKKLKRLYAELKSPPPDQTPERPAL